MRKLFKRPRVLAAMLLVAILAAGYLLVPVAAPRVSQANCERIKLGWTEKEVEDLLGKPTRRGRWTEYCWVSAWRDEDGNEIQVICHDVVNVIRKEFLPTKLSRFDIAKQRIARRLRALWPGS